MSGNFNLPIDEDGKVVENMKVAFQVGADFISTTVPILDKEGRPTTVSGVFEDGHLRGIRTKPSSVRVDGKPVDMDSPIKDLGITSRERPVEVIPSGGRQG